MKLNKTSQPWVMKPGTSPASESGSFSKLFSTSYSWHRIRWTRTHMFHFMKTQYNVHLQQHENKLEITKFSFILVWIKSISLLFMHMCVCTCLAHTPGQAFHHKHLYWRHLWKKEASSNINTIFPELYLHKDRKFYSKLFSIYYHCIYYKKPSKSNQNIVAEAETKHKNMVRVNENTGLLNKLSFLLP